MKRFLAILFLLIATSAFAEDKYGGVAIFGNSGGSGGVPAPGASGQFLGSFGTNPEWQVLSGGNGNCTITRTGIGTAQLNCSYASNSNPTFTGTVTMPDGTIWTSAGPTFKNTSTITFPDGSTWNSTNGLTANNITTSNLTASKVTINPSGTFVGPDGSVWSSAGITNLKSLILLTALPTGSGGTGTSAHPTPGQILIGQANGTYTPLTISGDISINSNGVATITGSGGVTFGNIVSLNVGTGLVAGGGNLNLIVPVAPALGGTGTIQVPNAGSFLIGQANHTYSPAAISGDISILPTGVTTVTRINGAQPGGTCPANQYVTTINTSGVPSCAPAVTGSGVPNGSPPQFVGYSATNTPAAITLTGNANCKFIAQSASVYALDCGYATSNNPVFTGTVTMPDGATWTNTGIQNGTSASFTNLLTAGTLNVTNNMNVGGTATINNLTVTGSAVIPGASPQIVRWNPDLLFNDAACSGKTGSGTGYYIKTGHLVHFQFQLAYTSFGTCTGTHLSISLPFPPSYNVADNFGWFPIYFVNVQNLPVYVPYAILNGTQQELELIYIVPNSGNTTINYFSSSQVYLTAGGLSIEGSATFMTDS